MYESERQAAWGIVYVCGCAFARADKHQRALEHLATATAMYREIEMTYWLEQVEAEVEESA